MTETTAPLSVRHGRRDPLPYAEGVPDHLRDHALNWVSERVRSTLFLNDHEMTLMALRLGMPACKRNEERKEVVEYCRTNDEFFLDVLDYLLQRCVTEHGSSGQLYSTNDAAASVQELSNLFEAGRSCWKVSWKKETQKGSIFSKRRYYLERRVTELAEKNYLQAIEVGGSAEEKLTKAWHAAFSREESAEQCWKASVAAVEAVLQPIVYDENPGARLGVMRKDIKAAPRKWECDLPVWGDEDITPVDAFLNVLNRITYDPGRHGGDTRIPEIHEARAVLMVAVTVVEWVRSGVFRRSEEF